MKRWLAAAGLALVVAGCGDNSVPDDPRERLLDQCASLIGQAGQVALPQAAVDATCRCVTNAMADEGLRPADLFGEGQDRAQQLTLDCARANGLPVG